MNGPNWLRRGVNLLPLGQIEPLPDEDRRTIGSGEE
jgi:hypothetical protein